MKRGMSVFPHCTSSIFPSFFVSAVFARSVERTSDPA
jgi:hypothetical protein